MTAASELKALYARHIAEDGETITLRRGASDISVRARVVGYQAEELVGGIVQGDRKVIALADDVTFDPPLRRGDKAVIRNRVMNIEFVDDSTRRVGGVLVAYELTVRG